MAMLSWLRLRSTNWRIGDVGRSLIGSLKFVRAESVRKDEVESFPLITARLASDHDEVEIEGMKRQFLSEIRDLRGASAYLEMLEFSERAIGSSAEFRLVAEIDMAAVGYADVKVATSEVATLLEFFVDRRARKIGVGQELFELIVVELKRRSVSRLDVLCLPGMRDYKNLLERNGYRTRLLIASSEL